MNELNNVAAPQNYEYFSVLSYGKFRELYKYLYVVNQ
jgi:hypothetical protein